MVVLGGTEGDRLLAGLDENLVLNGGGCVYRDHTESHGHRHILDGIGDPFLGHFDLDATKTGINLVLMGHEGLSDSVVLGHEGKTSRDLMAARDVGGGEAEGCLHFFANSKGICVDVRGVPIKSKKDAAVTLGYGSLTGEVGLGVQSGAGGGGGICAAGGSFCVGDGSLSLAGRGSGDLFGGWGRRNRGGRGR